MSRLALFEVKSLFSASILALSILASPQAKADLISNGDFATGNLTGWTPFVTSNGTNGSGLPAVVSFNTTGAGASNSAQFNVGQVRTPDSTQQGGGISQTIDVTTAGEYDFNAAIASQAGAGNANAGLFSILIDGTPEKSLNFGRINDNQTLRSTLDGSVFLTSSTHTFSVEITRPNTSGGTFTPRQYVTDISLTPVPEPKILLPTALLLTGLAFWKRRIGVRGASLTTSERNNS